MFHALLVSKDDEAASVLTPVLSGFGLDVVCCHYPDAARALTERKFDAVIVDFDGPHGATQVLRKIQQSSSRKSAVTVALLSDKSKVRQVFAEGANFVLYKPISSEQARASLPAAIALIKRERRCSPRVPLQVPVQLKADKGPGIEGILLGLSEDGMEVMASQPLCPTAPIEAHFHLLQGKADVQVRCEVAWANPNGQAGVRFLKIPENVREMLKTFVRTNASDDCQDPEPVLQCKLTDLSLGGCYVETESPFPERSGITLCLKAESVEVRAEGRVDVMHPGVGMGIEFASSTAAQHAQVARFIGFLSSHPGTLPQLLVTPRALTARDDDYISGTGNPEDLHDPLLELLRRPGSLSQEEFLQELHRQRHSKAASA